MRKKQIERLRLFARNFFAPLPKERPSDWALRTIRFNEPGNRGPITFSGREYARQPLDDFADPRVRYLILVFGSQLGKTVIIMVGAAWRILHMPTRIVWAMANENQARSFSRTRWVPMLRASPELSGLIPAGADRHSFKALEQMLGGAIVNFCGSNSPANLASNPAAMTIADEVDKFDDGGNGEADAVDLLEQRAKGQSDPKHVQSSTPTLVEGIIWQKLRMTDQMRRFLPCVHCGKMVVLAWSKAFTMFKLTGKEAFISWDPACKREDGTYDLDRVVRSACYVCPHCSGSIHDDQRIRMGARGEWVSTVQGAPGFRGYHLPSLYGSSQSCQAGQLALRFLNAKQSLLGLQGFINGELAEPWESQETRAERVELVTPPDAPPIEGATKLLTVDVQLLSPFFWYVIRAWKDGASRLVTFGHCDTIEELRQLQIAEGVRDNHVIIDSGFNASLVYESCLRFGQLVPISGSVPLWVGWTPAKGFQRKAQWMDKQSGGAKPYNLGSAAIENSAFRLPLLEFSDHHVADILHRLRKGDAPFPWEVKENTDQEYWQHMDSEIKKMVYQPRTNRATSEWVKRSKHIPNHLLDCEREQVVGALLHKLLPLSVATVAPKEGDKIER